MRKTKQHLVEALLLVLFCHACGGDDLLPPVPSDPARPPGRVEYSRVESPDLPGDKDVRCTYGQVEPVSAAALTTPGPFAVASEAATFVDSTRTTPKNGSYGGSDRRTLKTTLYYPAQPKALWQLGKPAVAKGGPFPLLVYSHGFSSSKEEAKPLATHLASYGYIVIAPTFPLSSMLAPGGATFVDLVNQPGDVAFLIDQLVAKSTDKSDRFFGAVDDQRVGVVGLSLGGLTTYLTAFHPSLGDPRIKLAVSLAGPSSFFTAKFFQHRAIPLLLIHGDIDAFIPYEENARVTLKRAQPNVNLVTVISGSHAGFASMGPELLMKLLGQVVAPEGAHPDNPDALGCGFVGQQINDDVASNTDFFQGLGDEAVGIIVPKSEAEALPLPCDNDFITKPALSPSEQVKITKKATLAFLQAYFGASSAARQRHCHFLNEVLGEDPNVRFE